MRIPDLFEHGRQRRRAARVGRGLVPVDGRLDGLIDNVGTHRARPVRALPVELTGSAPSGVWVPMPKVDYVLFPHSSSPTRREAVLCHEIGHILLGHEPAFHEWMTPELLTSIAPRLSPAASEAILFRDGYSTTQEADAEYVGTVLVAALAAKRRTSGWERSSLLSERLR